MTTPGKAFSRRLGAVTGSSEASGVREPMLPTAAGLDVALADVVSLRSSGLDWASPFKAGKRMNDIANSRPMAGVINNADSLMNWYRACTFASG